MLVSQFLVNLKRRGQYQAAQTVLSDADYVAMANDEMRMVICPKILSVRQNYFMGQKDYQIGSSRRFRLPSRILGSRISLVRITTGTDQFYDLPQTSINQSPINGRQGFYVSEGDLILTGSLPSGILRIFYPVRPPKMSATATIIATCTAPGDVNFNTDYVGANITAQVIRSSSPFRTISPNCQVGTGASYDMDSPFEYERFQSGDQVIVVDSTPAVPLEQELCDWLLQRTHMRVLAALGQTDQLAAQGSKLADIERDCLALINPRVADQPKTIQGMQSAGWNY